MVGLFLLALILLLWLKMTLLVLACLPGLIALVIASYIPKRFRYFRIVVLSTITALLVVPVVVSKDEGPTLRPIFTAVVNPRIPIENSYESIVIWGIATWIFTALILLRRSDIATGLPDANAPRNHVGSEVAVSDAMRSNSTPHSDARASVESEQPPSPRAGGRER